MAVITNCVDVMKAPRYEVIHPLDDVKEAKCSVEGLGEMHMTRSVKLSLCTLRGYLILMAMLVGYRLTESLLVGYRLLATSGVLGHRFL